jgi:GntR family transcriptional repressor for pyruvate dehydrogenase complex
VGYLTQSERDVVELLDFREALEPPIAARAAERATSVDVRRLSRISADLEAEDDPAKAADLDAQFHHAIALATRNHVLVMLVETSLEVLNQTRRQNLQTPARLEMSRRAHRAILAAIEAGDPDAAGHAMTNHIREVAALVIRADRPSQSHTETTGDDDV